jgi:hypothetical protein
MNKIAITLFTALCLLFVASCHTDIKKQLERKWKMQGEDVTLELKNNGTYLFTEHNKPQEGHWSLKDNKTIVFIGEDSSSNANLLIKALDDKKLQLIINGVGEEMNFRAE